MTDKDVEMEPVENPETVPETETNEEPTNEPNETEAVENVPEQPAAPEVVENEEDQDQLPTSKMVKANICMNEYDSTLNVFANQGNLITCLAADPYQNLLGGVRSDHGIVGGRLYFEARVLESFGAPHTFPSLRIGLSSSSSNHIVGEPCTVGFDMGGGFHSSGKRSLEAKRVVTEKDIIGVLVNMEPGHVNENTISLFKNGERASSPLALPEDMLGKPFYPTITLRGLSVIVNFGNFGIWKELPFKPRMVQHADKAHVQPTTIVRPKNDQYEVIMPVGIPDQGTYDVVDEIHAKHPLKYIEISERAIMKWAQQSGLRRHGNGSVDIAVDTPETNYGIKGLDGFSCKQQLLQLAATVRRNVIIMNVNENLIPERREAILSMFVDSRFQKIALVSAGAAPSAFRLAQQEAEQKIAQAKLDADVATKRRQLTIKRKEAEAQKLKAKAAAAAAKKAEEAKKEATEEGEKKEETNEEGAEAEKQVEENKDEEKKDEEKKDEEMKEEPAAEEQEEEEEEEELKPVEEEIPDEVAELDTTVVWRNHSVPDVPETTVNENFSKYSLPTEEEEFNTITWNFAKQDEAKEALAKFVDDKKVSVFLPVKAGTWFTETLATYNESISGWKKGLSEYKDSQKLAAEKAKVLNSVENAEAKTEDETAETAETAVAEDESKTAAHEEELLKMEVWDVEDVKNAHEGVPLFYKFQEEDWVLLQCRFELHLMLRSFKKDSPDHPGIHESLLAKYYTNYFSKHFRPQMFGAPTVEELLTELLKENFEINDGIVEACFSEDDVPADTFVKVTEEARRIRQQRIDSGDETAVIKLDKTVPPSRNTKGKGKGNFQGSYQSYNNFKGGKNKGKGGYGMNQMGQMNSYNRGKGNFSSYAGYGQQYGGGGGYGGQQYSAQKRSYGQQGAGGQWSNQYGGQQWQDKRPRTGYNQYGR